jgi:hypothetical protein
LVLVVKSIVDVRGLLETRELLESFTGNQLQNRVRVATRAGAKVMRTEVRQRATGSQYPRSFRKTATRGHRTPVGTSTGPTSPLLNIFEGGADQHAIGGRGQVLSNFENRRQEAGGYHGGLFFARGPVGHPGMGARPLIGPVFEATKDEAAEAAMDALFTEHPPAFALSEG